MNNLVIYIFIFSLVLFFYLHICFQYKKSNDLEIYELDNISKEKLEEITNLKQPLLFNYNNDLQNICKKESLLDKYGVFDVKIRDVKNKIKDDDELYVPLKLVNSLRAIENDKNSKFLTENNMEFIEETNLIKKFRYNDIFLRPYFIQSCNYDICIGSNNCVTPLKYDLNCRNYLLVNEGSVNIKLFPPKYSKYLHCIKDYENFEFRSEINPWNVESIYKNDFEKVKCINLELKPDRILSIPPFWWYSIKFNNDTSVCFFKYKTFMNFIAISPQLFMKFLQMKNVKRLNFSRVKNNKDNNVNNSEKDNVNDNVNNSEKDNINDNVNNNINDNVNNNINDNSM